MCVGCAAPVMIKTASGLHDFRRGIEAGLPPELANTIGSPPPGKIRLVLLNRAGLPLTNFDALDENGGSVNKTGDVSQRHWIDVPSDWSVISFKLDSWVKEKEFKLSSKKDIQSFRIDTDSDGG